MEKQRPSLVESYYLGVESDFPKAITRLVEESDFVADEVGGVILEAVSMRGDGFSLLCECRVDGKPRHLQINGRTANELLFGAGNARFDVESLSCKLLDSDPNRLDGLVSMKLNGDTVDIPLTQHLINVRGFGVVYAGYVDMACAELSLRDFSDLYPGCMTVDEVAAAIVKQCVRRQKAEIVTMVKNTWGE
jgi:hypothetical protein